ncbi:MAG TPA: hypothetical protein VFS41_01085 [Edaphobacter sp.]|nr:hypothetical protein [Edaphobacter sp.]
MPSVATKRASEGVTWRTGIYDHGEEPAADRSDAMVPDPSRGTKACEPLLLVFLKE